MALSRRLGVVAILGSCWFMAVACGDDDSNKASDNGAGAGGEAGDDSGSGGSQNNAGKSGSSTAGKNNGGNSGTGGAVGGTGTGGNQLGGAAGEGAAPGGGAGGEGATPSGGAGGEGAVTSGGAGGEGGAAPLELNACFLKCVTDNDCIRPPDNSEYKCDPETKTCKYPSDCAATPDCVVARSFFSECESDATCFEDIEACITYEGKGYCGSLPIDGECFGSSLEELPRFGANGTAAVCVDRTNVCNGGACEPGCLLLGCGLGEGDTCNETTGKCECAEPTECDTGICNPDHSCQQCVTNDDCEATADKTGLDVCVDGSCGCSAASKCVNPGFQGVTKVCE